MDRRTVPPPNAPARSASKTAAPFSPGENREIAPLGSWRILTDEAASSTGPNVAMPKARTELSELLAGDDTVCVRRRPEPAKELASAASSEVYEELAPSIRRMPTQADRLIEMAAAAGKGPGLSLHVAESGDVDRNLARVVAAWPLLPPSIHAAMVAMVEVVASER